MEWLPIPFAMPISHEALPPPLAAPQFYPRRSLALGEFAESLFFSQRIVPEKALTNGFNFQFPDLDSALMYAVPR